MTTAIYDDARSFRMACDCQRNEHGVDIWIEVEPDQETHEITVTFCRELDTPWWQSGFNRFRDRINILQVLEEMKQEWNELRALRKQYEDRLMECREKSQSWTALKQNG